MVPLDSKLTVTRIAGSNRFETNRKVNEYAAATSVNPVGTTTPLFGKAKAKTAILVNGMAPWDALAAGPLVSKVDSAATGNPLPLILTDGKGLEANARLQVQHLDIQHALLVGGADVLTDGAKSELSTLGTTAARLSGQDRWGTAAAIADFAFKSADASATNTSTGLGFAAHQGILANGGSMNGSMVTAAAKAAWADALAAGPMAAAQSRVIVLTDSRSLPGTTKDLLTKYKSKLDEPILTVGLGDVVSTETVAAANAAIAG